MDAINASKTFSKVGVPHTIDVYTPVELLISQHFGISESVVRQYVDVENNEQSFDDLAKWIEECRILVVDESTGTIHRYGTKGRVRRELILSLSDSLGAVIRLPPFVHSALLHATRGNCRIDLTRTCCQCYTIAFLFGICVGICGFSMGIIAFHQSASTSCLFRSDCN